MTDGNEIELRIWSDEIYERIVHWFKALTGAGCSPDQATEHLRPMIDYVEALDLELLNAK